MYRSSLSNNSAIPEEYRKAAENLFPLGEGTAKKSPDFKAAAGFAAALGVGTEYKKFLNLNKISLEELDVFLDNFQNNLDLLIQKTWVEKADESRKEILLNEVPGFIDGIEKRNFRQALKEFGSILAELAYLFFGAQSVREDFTEYTFRIDPQMGLFWWYGSQLGCLEEEIEANANPDDPPADNESLWALLLIGICYLTNF